MIHDLSTNYSREYWIDFLQNEFLPNDFSLRREKIEIDFKSKYIKPKAYWIGDCESLGDLAIIEVSHASEKDPRIGVSRDAFRLMAEHGLSKALFFFLSDNSKNYRFSLITLDLKLEGKNIKYLYSNPKRFSFYLGEDAKLHTPQEFLFEKGRINNFEDLQSRFSIEIVNKEFYGAIQRLFYKLVGGKVKQGSRNIEFKPMLKLPSTNDHETMQEFSVRLVGRLVFCWFLKKKKSNNGIPLIPENVLSSEVIKQNYYHNVIEPLFFELLNTPIDERRQNFRNTEYDLIPFLNGGLFDPNLHEDYYKYSPMEKEYKPAYNLVIPDEWLKEFITLLETYNFTIDENTSIDIDLSVDPEMLGRIFENLLAEINPETGDTARKATGSYYTPRPIVEYMVDESLVQYLLTKTDIEEQPIRELLDYNIENTELTKQDKISVIDALDDIKVLDPACGSGAFPMGILQKMLLILQKVDPESIEWVIRQLVKIPNKLVREALEEKLMNENWKYKHKMGIIQNAIYGVDIQPIATEISKLRLFLTLIVDENIIDDEPNRNIHPLPNLSFKFVTANTLIELPNAVTGEQMDLMNFDNVLEPLMKKLETLREEFFYSSGEDKVNIEKEFIKTQKEIGQFQSENASTNKRATALVNWNPFKDKSSTWFDPHWMFGIEDGFDIVIANPPYGADIPTNQLEIMKSRLVDTNNTNSASMFIDITKNFLIGSEGILTYIVPKSLLYSQRWYSLVESLIDNTVVLVDVEKAFDNVLLEQVFFVFNNGIISNKYKALKFINDTFTNSILIDNKYALSLESWICDVTKYEISLLNKCRSQNITYMKNISVTKRGVGIQKYLESSGDFSVIGGKNIQKFKINDTKGFISKEILNKYKKKLSFMNNKKIVSQDLIAHVQNPYPHVILINALDLAKDVLSVDTVQNTILNCNDFFMEYVLSLLNSKFISWYVYKFIYCSAIRTMHFDRYYIGKIPVKIINKRLQFQFQQKVNNIIILKNTNELTQILEDQIDLMVYKLYELNYDEVLIVDPECPFSKEEYEKFKFADLPEDESEIEEQNTDIKEPELNNIEPTSDVILLEFTVGQHVIHPTFGEGEVQHVAGKGENATVFVKFGKETKKLVAGYAKLRGVFRVI